MVIMAIDLGEARTGLAICDKMELLASPLDVIKEKDKEKLISIIIEKAKSMNVEQFVLGLPKNMDGTEGKSAKNAYDFKEKLETTSGIKVDLQDERYTTISAYGYLNETNTRGKKRKSIVDKISASIILEDYIKYKNR